MQRIPESMQKYAAIPFDTLIETMPGFLCEVVQDWKVVNSLVYNSI